MSMEQRNYDRDWKAPVALVLAGLALFIALGDRNLFHFGGSDNQFVEVRPLPAGIIPPVEVHPWPVQPAVPVMPTVVPAAPSGGGFYIAPDGSRGMLEQKLAESERIMGQIFAAQDDPGPRFWQGGRRWFGPFMILLALGLIFLGWRMVQKHNRPAPAAYQPPYQGPPPPPPGPPPAPGYGPGTPPPPGPPYYGDITQRQVDS